jgi:hypothetical protein
MTQYTSQASQGQPPTHFDIPLEQMVSPFASPPVHGLNIKAQNPSSPTSMPKDDPMFRLPGKYEGYKELSRWMASSDDFFIIRRFQSSNALVILYMQYRIVGIEDRLNEIHERIEKEDFETRNSSFLWDERFEPERARLLVELTGLLHHYSEYRQKL